MKKRHAIILSAMLAVGFASSAQAGKYKPAGLVTIIPGGCSIEQIAPFGTSLLASWSWEGGTTQSKFGGDAVYTVTFDYDGVSVEMELEFEVEQYVPDTAAEDYPGQLVYRCSNAQDEAAGTCKGSVLGLRSAIADAFEDADLDLGLVTNLVGNLDEVGVKALKGSGRQNYAKVDVCVVPL